LLKIKLNKPKICLPAVCVTCGTTFVIEKVEAILWAGEKRVGNVCNECIKIGCQELPLILRKQSQNLRERAKVLEELSEKSVECPTWEEYKQAFKEAKGVKIKTRMIMSRVLLIGEEIIPREEIEGLSSEHMKIFLTESDPEKWPLEISHLKKYLEREQEFY
jgi:hypothetical protein